MDSSQRVRLRRLVEAEPSDEERAADPHTPPLELTKLLHDYRLNFKITYRDEGGERVGRALAGNPNLPAEDLLLLADEFPEEFLRNPALRLHLLENPGYLDDLDSRAREVLWRYTSYRRLVSRGLAPGPRDQWGQDESREVSEAWVPDVADVPVVVARQRIFQQLREEGHPLLRLVQAVWRKIYRDVVNVEENGEPPASGQPGVTREDFENYFGEYVLAHVPAQYRRNRKFWALLRAWVAEIGGVDGLFLDDPGILDAMEELTGLTPPAPNEDWLLSPREVFELFPRFAKLLYWLYRRVTPQRWGDFVIAVVDGPNSLHLGSFVRASSHTRREFLRTGLGATYTMAAERLRRVDTDRRQTEEVYARFGLTDPEEIDAVEALLEYLAEWKFSDVQDKALLFSAYAANVR